MSDEGKPHYVNSEAVGVCVNVPPVTVLITTHLWILWAHIAIRSEARARDARKLAATAKEGASSLLGSETEEALVSITAVGNLFYNLEESWSLLLPDAARDDLPVAATVDPPDAKGEWLKSIKNLYRTRGNAVHFSESPKPPQPHPSGSSTSPENVTFRVENATRAVDLMFDVLTRAIESPSEQLEAWSSSFGLTLTDLRQRRELPS